MFIGWNGRLKDLGGWDNGIHVGLIGGVSGGKVCVWCMCAVCVCGV